jgi:hypothetical protein
VDTDPASANPGRMNASFAISRAASVLTVCRESGTQAEAVGRVAVPAVPVLPSPDRFLPNGPLGSGTHRAHKPVSEDESARRSGRAFIDRANQCITFDKPASGG